MFSEQLKKLEVLKAELVQKIEQDGRELVKTQDDFLDLAYQIDYLSTKLESISESFEQIERCLSNMNEFFKGTEDDGE